MIPKTIHYCWFGKNAFPNAIQSCIDSWHKNLKEYKFMRWDEENFDLDCNKYVKQAYESKKWAFVSDYARLWVLYHHGGVYLDCDVRALKPIDSFLSHAFFSGYENKANPQYIPTGTIGAEKGHPFIKLLLEDYEDRSFIKQDGTLDMTTNVVRITNMAKELYGFVGDGMYQVFGDDINIYPYDYFSGFNGSGLYGDNSYYDITQNTCTIHEFASSWYPKHRQIYRKIRIKYPIINRLEKIIRRCPIVERAIRRM